MKTSETIRKFLIKNRRWTTLEEIEEGTSLDVDTIAESITEIVGESASEKILYGIPYYRHISKKRVEKVPVIDFIMDNPNLTSTEISELTGHCHASVNEYIRSGVRTGIIISTKREDGKFTHAAKFNVKLPFGMRNELTATFNLLLKEIREKNGYPWVLERNYNWS